jgi:DNA-binding MarR family transcriptional regulator
MDLSELSTYQALVYQSKANRSIKTQFEKTLKHHNLTMMQWSVLGFVKEAGKTGIRISDLAQKIDTSLAFITNSVNTLEAKGMVQRLDHSTDNRAKLICIAPNYRRKIDSIEAELRTALGAWVESRASVDELVMYIKVLKNFAQAEQ